MSSTQDSTIIRKKPAYNRGPYKNGGSKLYKEKYQSKITTPLYETKKMHQFLINCRKELHANFGSSTHKSKVTENLTRLIDYLNKDIKREEDLESSSARVSMPIDNSLKIVTESNVFIPEDKNLKLILEKLESIENRLTKVEENQITDISSLLTFSEEA